MRISVRPLASLFFALSLGAAVPTPKEHLGHEAGADNKIADFNAIRGYFEKLAKSSDRIKLEEFGRSANGRPMFVAYMSSPENLRQLDRYKQINRRLALGKATPEEAKRLAREGKAIVWIDSGLHATEIAPAQHAPELAYRMLTDESDEVRKIRETPRATIERLQGDLKAFIRDQKVAHLIVVNVSSTEPAVDPATLPPTWSELDKLIDRPSKCPLPASSLYAIAALDLGCSYINFTPSLGSTPPAIGELAIKRGTRHMGYDGKTGETLLKSTLAPMFAKATAERIMGEAS